MQFPTFFLGVAIKVSIIAMVVGIFGMMCSGYYILIFFPSLEASLLVVEPDYLPDSEVLAFSCVYTP
jgi:hypothetical protein